MASAPGTLRDRLVANPFHVLGLPPDASRAAVEREGQKLLGMLDLGLAAAATYDTPLGPRARTRELVREAMAELRVPALRARHEPWARLGALRGPDPLPASPAPVGKPADVVPWVGALRALGWERP